MAEVETLPTEIVGDLLASIFAIADESPSLADRRSAVLNTVAGLVKADAGFWAWGHGWPDEQSSTPIAQIDFGLTDEQRLCLMTALLDREAQKTMQRRIAPLVRLKSRATSGIHDVYTQAEWDTVPVVRQQLAKAGFESWLHSVRYSAANTWSVLFLLRRIDRTWFGQEDAEFLDFAHTNVIWLHSTITEYLAPETFVSLTPRQRTVMMLLLDGLERKQMAHQLNVTEDTIGDHIKAIYRHFSVGSAMELAAYFLKSR